MLASLKIAFVTVLLSTIGLTPVWCESCGEMYVNEELETHTFEEWHEYDNNGEITYEIHVYDMSICQTCVDYLAN